MTTNEWDPNDLVLLSGMGPFEPSAAFRLAETGWPGNEILKACNLRGTHLVNILKRDRNARVQARRQHRPIHDAKLPEGTT